MADTKISGLSLLAGSSVSSSVDVFPIVSTSAATTKKISVQGLYDAANTLVSITSGQVSSADVISVYSVSAAAAKLVTLASAAAGVLTPITSSLGADVVMNNNANYFDGPSVAQGTSGTWFAIATVTYTDTATAGGSYNWKLWDGTTVISSARTSLKIIGYRETVTLSGYLASPAGNIKISGQSFGTLTGRMYANESGNSKDCTITAIRIA